MRQAADSFVGSVVEERYRVEERLGAGAMGTVYRGRHVKVGRTVAIKVLHDELVSDASMVERFEREAKIAARLHHPNVVAVLDLATDAAGRTLMVMEHAPGRPLADHLWAPLGRTRAIELTRQLLLGLEHAHAMGLVHRDLKPENVLVERTTDGVEIARIVDFGIATLRDEELVPTNGRPRLTTTGMVLGTPAYMSPEQAQGERVDQRCDLFALGVIVYEMLAGKAPFDGNGVEVMMQNIVQDPPSIATRTGRDVDPRLEAFARKLMARDLRDRFASASAALEVLEGIAADSDGVPVPVVDAPTKREQRTRTSMSPIRIAAEVVEQPAPPRVRRWGTAFGAVALAAGVLAGFVVGMCCA